MLLRALVIMDLLVKINSQTVGRDKIIRLLQYGSRAGWYYAQSNEAGNSSVNVLKSLEYTFSSFRKLLRFGRFIESLHSALSSIKCPDLIMRITVTLSKIANALFLLADHIIWIGRAGVLRVNLEKWNKISNKYWLFTIIMNLTRDIYEIIQIMELNNLSTSTKINSSTNNFLRKYQFQMKNHRDVLLDTVKNACDFFIPMTALGYTKLNPGTVGLLGLTSSLIGLYCLIDPLAKLTPV